LVTITSYGTELLFFKISLAFADKVSSANLLIRSVISFVQNWLVIKSGSSLKCRQVIIPFTAEAVLIAYFNAASD